MLDFFSNEEWTREDVQELIEMSRKKLENAESYSEAKFLSQVIPALEDILKD